MRRSKMPIRRRICFVTGTRAEFGLMHKTLLAIKSHPKLQLQIVATGMHLDPRHGESILMLRKLGWAIDATVPCPASAGASGTAQATGAAMAGLARIFE